MKRILIVEDNPINMELTTQLLEDDYELLTATDGAAGLSTATEHGPDLILMDLSLPVMDGWEAIRKIRASAKIGHTPIIALSAHAAQADIERAMAAGASDYVTKPVDEDVLLERIEALLGRDG
jgi:CheY-like chemotaxis protein